MVIENPANKPFQPDPDLPDLDNPYLENPALIITNNINNLSIETIGEQVSKVDAEDVDAPPKPF